MLTKNQQELYDSFYESTYKNEHLDQKTGVLAKVMAVAVGQKRLQLKEVIEDYGIDLKSYE